VAVTKTAMGSDFDAQLQVRKRKMRKIGKHWRYSLFVSVVTCSACLI
jgi:hypothetical protein